MTNPTATSRVPVQRAGGLGLGLFALLLASPAFAHHAMDGRTPSTAVEGLLSGLAHPVIGLDHFAFVVALGLLASATTRRFVVPAAFVAATLAGTALHLLRVDLAAVEGMVALSVIAAGVLLALNLRQHPAWLLVLAVVAGVVHGYAYGESIVGAEATPLTTYLLGFGLVQFGIALLAGWSGQRMLDTTRGARARRFGRTGGAIVCAVGAVYLALALFVG